MPQPAQQSALQPAPGAPSQDMQLSQASPNTAAFAAPADSHHHHHRPPASSTKRPRHRASIACASCRDRRIRCVVRPGETECFNCRRTGAECIIRNDDERRKPISRAYVASLTERIAVLEDLLRRKGEEPPPVIHPPRIRPGLPGSEELHPERGNDSRQESSQPPHLDNASFSESDDGVDQSVPFLSAARTASSPRLLDPSDESQSLVSQLLAPKGHLGIDQTSGSVRFFGSLMNCHLPSDKATASKSSEVVEHARRATKTIRLLSQETHDHLMHLFWEHFNAVLHVIHKEAFLADYEHGSPHFYSPFLHICILAVGFRYADKARPDIQRIALEPRESTFHREAKFMLDVELERPGGIPQVQALLLLANCECSVGRDHTGWLYSGMGVRLAFDIGLHLETRSSGLSEREVDVRHMALWACVIFDKYWSLFLGRPTAIKSSDLEVYTLAKRFERLGTCLPNGPELSLETQIYEALIDLMEIAGKAAENREATAMTGSSSDRTDHRSVVALDRELSGWYSRLPEALRWEPANIQTAPRSFFVLHQQYHSVHIQIRRPLARYEDSVSPEAKDLSGDTVVVSARKACTGHAIAVVKNFWHYRQRFSAKQIFCAAMQTAGVACTTLIADLAFVKDVKERNQILKCLKCMAVSLQDMSAIFAPAERMCLVLQHVLAEISQSSPQREASIVPASRQNTEDDTIQSAPKRRQRSDHRPTPPLRRSEGSGSMPQLRLSVDDIASLPDSHPDADVNEANGLFPSQGDLSAWPFSSQDSQVDVSGSSMPGSAPAMYGNMAPNAWVTATSQMPDAPRMSFSHFPGFVESGTHTGQMDFLSPNDETWAHWRLEQPQSQVRHNELDAVPPDKQYR
ncbi:nitrogen assimilation transcription factor nit-4 [Diplodia corticola]|uniref:Nitrogen assimilation transcription factor nit-4 n=1 Tax=Diplodia corticola TaxID=236234 RepID=A0A1J9S734_9PEZI|nr:nitrogen assimilation transcription factor nit-4 [Diplodia corticola]OJD40763.1 nitrogen assimilation transcription factor nit-4 [Diplodia corticola]